MAVSRIKNPWLRRIIIVLLLPPLILACIGLGAAEGACDWLTDLWRTVPIAWKGR